MLKKIRSKTLEVLLAATILSFISYNSAALAAEPLQTNLEKYNAHQFRILIVPGHDNNPISGGTSFGGIKEAELNLRVATDLYKLLSEDKHFQVFITREANGYKEPFASYFADNVEGILALRDSSLAENNAKIQNGSVVKNQTVPHNSATLYAVTKLYGANKWANDNNVDLVIHVHFNDHGGRPHNRVGKYSGFAIYIPEKQLSNHAATNEIVQPIFAHLSKIFAVNNNPLESAGIIEDQDLIAVGANNSIKSNIASLLIEYGFIYEEQWLNPKTSNLISKELAFQTYAGLKAYFEPNVSPSTGGPMAKFVWPSNIKRGGADRASILALQIALTRDGLYPPPGFTKNQCPISGVFGGCTEASVMNFQIAQKLSPTGYVDSPTRSQLNKVYGHQLPELASRRAYTWNKDLHYGLKNDEDVRALQEALILQGDFTGQATGNFFELTRQAVIRFQKRHKFVSIPDTGYVGPYTRELLNNLYSVK